MDSSPMHAMPPARRSGKWFLILILCVLLAGGGYLAWRAFGAAGLTLVTERDIPRNKTLFFSAFGPGYPALQAGVSGESFFYDQFQWLADDGSLLPQVATLIFDAVGPQRDSVVTAPTRGWDKYVYTRSWRDGRQTPNDTPPKTVTREAATLYLSSAIHSEDPGYAVYHSPKDRRGMLGEAVLYDIAHGKIVASLGAPMPGEGIVFHRGERLLFVQRRYGVATVLEQNGNVLGRFPGYWCWGEDGTVWTMQGPQAQVLRWQEGTPALAALPVPMTREPRVQYYGDDARTSTAYLFNMAGMRPTDSRAGWMQPFQDPTSTIAVWHDGDLTAAASTDPPWHGGRGGAVGSTTGQTTRVLTLYREDKPAGTFRVPLLQEVMFSKVNHLCNEHLAFSADGKYLSWVIETKQGVKLYVFRTGR
ncbi:MAG: hypothetical protein ACYDCO_21750 [Armatimonadota bacterium]